ncbi:MAG: polyphosphate kinase 1 [Eubacteriales bacterium]|nr:polyphosphate kinase 1 [Eubacteriales bacterium]
MKYKALFFNRELSWLNFNARVLAEGINKDNPLLEQARFLSIVSSNLDEFFMVRVGKLERKMDTGITRPDPAGLIPAVQLKLVRKAVADQVRRQYHALNDTLLPALRREGLWLLSPDELSHEQYQWLQQYFTAQVLPILTPRVIDLQRPFPILTAKALYVAVLLQSDKGGPPQLSLVPVPRAIDRVVMLPFGEGTARGILLEDIIMIFLPAIFPRMAPIAQTPFRITRNTDFVMRLNDMDNLVSEMSKSVKRRSYGKIVRLEVPAKANKKLLGILQGALEVPDSAVTHVEGPLDLRFFMRQLCGLPGFDALCYVPFTPRVQPRLLARESIFRTIRNGDLFFHHPYDSFDPITRLVAESAADPNVLAIKQTLYRVSSHSPLITALARAARNGKQVTVLIEVRARFDEEHNIAWSKSLETAGCHVLYGVPRWKTHSKLTLVIRREPQGLTQYVHVGTGNYNDVTARIYTDMGIMTCDKQIGEDAGAFFNLITGYDYTTPMRELIASPYSLRQEMVARIKREEEHARRGLPAGIMMKMNSLSDPEVISALLSAAHAGVKVLVMVRGICTLRYKPHENLRIYSLVGRFLEHSRVYVFENSGQREVFLSSADLMPRNLNKRVELTAPVKDKAIAGQIADILELGFLDNRKAWRLTEGNRYERVPRREPAINTQEELIRSENPLLDRQKALGYDIPS